MLTNIINSTTIPYLAQSISFAQSRHEVLAGNIANSNTPGYRTRDLSPEVFQERLKQLIEARDRPPVVSRSLGLGAPKSLGLGVPETNLVGDEADEALRKVREASRSILYHDDSDIGLEEQVLALSKNQMVHNVAIAIMNSQFRMLQAAVTERA